MRYIVEYLNLVLKFITLLLEKNKLAQKLRKNGLIKYLCENCKGVMFSIFRDTNDLIDQDNLIIFKKYLNIEDQGTPDYTCQFCGAVHKGYYKDNGSNIDFRPLIVSNGIRRK